MYIEIRVQWTINFGSSHMRVQRVVIIIIIIIIV